MGLEKAILIIVSAVNYLHVHYHISNETLVVPSSIIWPVLVLGSYWRCFSVVNGFVKYREGAFYVCEIACKTLPFRVAQ